jgi:hypothetical protein
MEFLWDIPPGGALIREPVRPTTTLSVPLSQPPVVFSTADGTIAGTLDGVNDVFTIAVPLKRARIFRNGQLMTLNVDAVHGGVAVKFLSNQIPQAGDLLVIQGWA